MKVLANHIRPQKLEDIISQDHLVGVNGVIKKMLEKDQILSMIIYGPAGCGKTTIARIVRDEIKCDFMEIDATNSNKKDLEQAIAHAKMSQPFLLIIDEIHRLNKDKQDILLPHIESGLITLIGITNTNPYHTINSAIRSRVILLEVFQPKKEDLFNYLVKVSNHYDFAKADYYHDLINIIMNQANLDIRYCLNQVELINLVFEPELTIEEVSKVIKPNIKIDQNQDYYYDAISSLQKSIRGSDVNASLFYLAILILAEDLDIIERRLSIIAYEDIGLANPQAVDRCLNALQVAKRVGFPEARIPLAFTTIELALSSKSNKAYQALDMALDMVNNNSYKFLEYLKQKPNYESRLLYHDIPYQSKHLIQYLPDEIKDTKFYMPNNKGVEEKKLFQIDDYLNKIKRTNDLEKLKRSLKISV